MLKISGTIITLNEEKLIERCIKSLQSVCDEIIVVDSYSTDRTQEIAQSLGAIVKPHQFLGHIEQKNLAVSLASNPWILSLDGDECLSDELIQLILKIKLNPTGHAYSFNRLTNYCGKWIHHCGWYPDKKIRLWNSQYGSWQGVNPHDIVIMKKDSLVTHIGADILHYSYESISSHVIQTNQFTSIAAKAAFAKGVRSNLFKIVSRPILKFFRDYFFKAGFLDGRYGFIICCINALSALLKYSKIRELEENKIA
jgi:glycosyltransferase involved in cell wall biosynthesis